jgi:hypothetical protein
MNFGIQPLPSSNRGKDRAMVVIEFNQKLRDSKIDIGGVVI